MKRLIRWVEWRARRPRLGEPGFASKMRAWRRDRPGGCRGRRCSEMHTYRRGCVLR